MKRIILSCLLLSGLVAFADDPAPATNSTTSAYEVDPTDERARAVEIRGLLFDMYRVGSTTSQMWDATEAKIESYKKDFGTTEQANFDIVILRKLQLMVARKLGDSARSNALLKKLSTDPLPEVAALAADQLVVQKQLDNLKSKPLALKFTDVDGKEVDLAQMRGKVVLVDFWATWCPPCRELIPGLVATYGKYHDKGFDVVGISLDQDKETMLAYMKQTGMTWPQYFDGQGWENTIAKSYGIGAIPELWLVDKKGFVTPLDPMGNLDAEVEKALAAPQAK